MYALVSRRQAAGTPLINKINALNFATSDIKLQIIRLKFDSR